MSKTGAERVKEDRQETVKKALRVNTRQKEGECRLKCNTMVVGCGVLTEQKVKRDNFSHHHHHHRMSPHTTTYHRHPLYLLHLPNTKTKGTNGKKGAKASNQTCPSVRLFVRRLVRPFSQLAPLPSPFPLLLPFLSLPSVSLNLRTHAPLPFSFYCCRFFWMSLSFSLSRNLQVVRRSLCICCNFKLDPTNRWMDGQTERRK